MAELRWGILSTARIAREKVIPGLRRADRCRIVAIASRDAARATEVAREAGIPMAYGSYEALLEDPTVDAVYIPLPNHLHAEWTIAAARAGKHILCEKPLALTSADAERMIEVADSEGVRLMEAFMYRLHPSWVVVRELVAAGRIGKLVAVQSWFSYFNDDPTNIRNIGEFGGGALFDIGYRDLLEKRLGIMDATAAALAEDRNMPTIVFDVSEKDAMVRAVLGEHVGTLVHAG